MNRPLYNLPGANAVEAKVEGPDSVAVRSEPSAAHDASEARTVSQVLAQSQVEAVMDELDRDLIGLAPVKQRVRDIAGFRRLRE